MRMGTPFSSNSRQWGQVSEPYSISFTLALGLPMTNPPADVALTTCDQSPLLGALTGVTLAGAWVAASPCLELQPAIATTAAAQARKTEGFIVSTAPIDLGNGCLALLRDQWRPVASRNFPGKRLQGGAQLGIGDLAQALSQLLGHETDRRQLRHWRLRRGFALAKDHAVDRGIAEEAVDPLDDQRRQVLDQRCVRAFDQQGEGAAGLLALREADRFGRRHPGVAFTHDLGPAADDRALNEAETLERLPSDVAEQLSGRARSAAAPRVFFPSLRHRA